MSEIRVNISKSGTERKSVKVRKMSKKRQSPKRAKIFQSPRKSDEISAALFSTRPRRGRFPPRAAESAVEIFGEKFNLVQN